MVAGPVVFMHFSARRWLHKLHDTIGATGLAAAAALPGLSAMLDQHAAAVRDATLGLETTPTASAVQLASYGHGVLHHAHQHGWQPPPPTDHAAWRSADWTSLRLTAICALARARHHTPPALPPLTP